MGCWRLGKVPRIIFTSFTFVALASLSQLPSTCHTAPGSDKQWSSWPYDTNSFASANNEQRLKEDWDNRGGNAHPNIVFGSEQDDEHQHIAEMATKTIVGIIVFLVLASFIAFLICLCCPICILAKMRQRRRGFVYQTASTNGAATTVQTGGATVTVINTRSAAPPPPPPSNATRTAYPQQQSVTVMPPQQQPHPPYGPPGMNYPNQAAPYPVNGAGMPMPMAGQQIPPPSDLPPPYPGLPREMDTLNQQPAYNPYYSGNQEAPNPYMPTTAPYPTK